MSIDWGKVFDENGRVKLVDTALKDALDAANPSHGLTAQELQELRQHLSPELSVTILLAGIFARLGA